MSTYFKAIDRFAAREFQADDMKVPIQTRSRLSVAMP